MSGHKTGIWRTHEGLRRSVSPDTTAGKCDVLVKDVAERIASSRGGTYFSTNEIDVVHLSCHDQPLVLPSQRDLIKPVCSKDGAVCVYGTPIEGEEEEPELTRRGIPINGDTIRMFAKHVYPKQEEEQENKKDL
jgi:hypothetical protein